MVELMVAWVTAGFSAPGVNAGSGSPGSRSAGAALLVGGRTPVALGTKDAPAAPEPSSLGSAIAAVGDAESAGVGVDALTDVDDVALAVTSGVDVTPAEEGGDAVEPEAQPAARRTTTAMEAQVRRPRPGRQRIRRLANAFSCPEPTIGSTPCRDVLPIGIWPPFPDPVVMRR